MEKEKKIKEEKEDNMKNKLIQGDKKTKEEEKELASSQKNNKE